MENLEFVQFYSTFIGYFWMQYAGPTEHSPFYFAKSYRENQPAQ